MPNRSTWANGNAPRASRAASVSPSSSSSTEVVDVVLAADVVQAADVRVVQRGDRLGLASEAGPELGITGQLRRKNLHGYQAVEARIAGAIHLAHPSGADDGENLVGAQTGTRLQGHADGSVIIRVAAGTFCRLPPARYWLRDALRERRRCGRVAREPPV